MVRVLYGKRTEHRRGWSELNLNLSGPFLDSSPTCPLNNLLASLDVGYSSYSKQSSFWLILWVSIPPGEGNKEPNNPMERDERACTLRKRISCQYNNDNPSQHLCLHVFINKNIKLQRRTLGPIRNQWSEDQTPHETQHSPTSDLFKSPTILITSEFTCAQADKLTRSLCSPPFGSMNPSWTQLDTTPYLVN